MRKLPTTLAIVLGALGMPAAGSAQAPEQAQLQVPMGQIEAFCNDYRQALAQCFAQRGVPAISGAASDDQITARRECKLEIQEEFDLHTASYCPHAEVDLAAAEYASMCVALNREILPCLEGLGYAAVVGEPLTPEEHAYLHHCREEAGANMDVAKRCGPPAYASKP